MIIAIDANEANVKNRVGSNEYAFQIINWLYKLRYSDLQFIIYLKNSPLADLPKEKSWWQYRVLKPKVLWTKFALPLELFLKQKKIDLFFTPGHYAPSLCPLPLVISIMDLAFLKYPRQFRVQDLHQLKVWTRKSVNQAIKILTISQSSKNDIMKYYQVAADKIVATYPGIKKINMSQSSLTILTKHNLKNSQYFLYIGTLQPRKNLVRLIQVFENIDDFKLVLVGKKGWLYDDILNQAKKLGIEDRVIFTGYVKEADKQALLKNAFAFVLPSLYEGFGFPVLEAMQQKTPVIVSRISSLPEVAGEAAIYIDDPRSLQSIKKALQKMIKLNKDQRKSLIEKGLKQFKKFSWKKTAQQTLQVLKEVADVHH